MRWRVAAVTGSLATAVMLLATACGSSDAGDSTPITISSLLGQPSNSTVDWQDPSHQIDELIALCMRDEGWQYIPLNLPDVGGNWAPENQRDQYAERGFGIAWSTLHVGEEDPNDPYANWVNPNQEYLDGLSESEQAAYWESLMGTEAEQAESLRIETDPVTGMETIHVGGADGYGPGCNGEAHEAVFGDTPSARQLHVEAVQAFYDDLDVRIAADPRVVALNATWSACMRDKGFDFDDPSDIWSLAFPEIQRRHSDIVSVAITGQEELTSEQRDLLEELLADEVTLTLAHFDCSQDYDAHMADLAAEIEQSFALEHEAELRRLAAALAEER